MSEEIDRSKLSNAISELQRVLEHLRIRCISDQGNTKELLANTLEQLRDAYEELSASNGRDMLGNEELIETEIAEMKSNIKSKS